MQNSIKLKKTGETESSRVAVAMSGGVDSSVAAALLVQDGYEVVGLTMKLIDQCGPVAQSISDRSCCHLKAIHRAQSVCHTLNIPHYSLDLVDDFKQYVIEDFVNEYIYGRTPNPCVRCNAYLKWGSLFQKARKLNCDWLATGHYARIEKTGNETYLLRALDSDKDQSYALWGIPSAELAKTLLPLGNLRKQEVRKIASRLKLKSADAPESQEICFVPDGRYTDFIQAQRPDFFRSLSEGELLQEEGGELVKVGMHSGYPYYTVGQRRGLGGGYSQPQYVLQVDSVKNRVIIGSKEKLMKRVFTVDQVNWLISEPVHPLRAQVQVRYRSREFPAVINPLSGEKAHQNGEYFVQFDDPVEAIAPGQSAVFYHQDRLLGGGRITNVLPVNQIHCII